MAAWQGLIHRYRSRMNLQGEAVSLCEGNTPLIPCPRLAEWVSPGTNLFIKYEGLNPTGSFKDRGMTTAITEAVHHGAKMVICASTGNTAASAAAYAARAGIKCVVLIPEGKVALGKLAGAMAYGAQVLQIEGSFDLALKMVRDLTNDTDVVLVNSLNPARLEGQKTAAFEVVEQLEAVPDWLCLPVGNAGNISAYWMGFNQMVSEGQVHSRPKILGAQAEGAAPIVYDRVFEQPETLATAIRIGNPARWEQANQAMRESQGKILAVTDEEIIKAYQKVAQLEGIFCEPSSAAGVAGLKKNPAKPGETVVCVLTGHGLKDPDSALASSIAPQKITASQEQLRGAIGC